MRKALTGFLFLALSVVARASLVVWDPGLAAQNAGNEVVNFAKWAKTEVDAAQTQLNTLQTYENTVLQLARMGNPAALRSLPGVRNIAELYQVYQQLTYDYQRLQGMVNPQNLQYNFNSILNGYGYSSWNGFQSLNGVSVSPNAGLYQFPVSNYNIGQNLVQQLAQLDQKKATLTQQRDAALQSLQTATDQSAVQKLHSSLTALNAAIADIDQSEQQLFNRGRIQQGQNAAAQQIYQASQAEQRQAFDYQNIDTALSQLPLGSFDKPALWGGKN
ncbi:MAG: hypothetical protein JOZ29_21150 [Deltaproteobacteria bacterium]|nr:hypothetical protein [Deltaproteobacteria bacterium]